MFIHDLIKIKYIQEGYLPDYPYKAISDKEMFEAFTGPDEGFFVTTYPCPDESVLNHYERLKENIFQCIDAKLEQDTPVPSWVYSYMLGECIGPNSDDVEIEYINELMNLDIPVITDFCKDTADAIYAVSESWLKKMRFKYEDRVPTIFGEPHVIKSLRLQDVDDV